MHPPESSPAAASPSGFQGRPLLDAMAAALFACCCAWLMLVGHRQAQDAVARYGHNVDSGVLEWATALFYLGPAALLFALASVAGWRRWRIARGTRWLSVVFALMPIVLGVVTCAVRR